MKLLERVDERTPMRSITIPRSIEELSLDRVDVLEMNVKGVEKEALFPVFRGSAGVLLRLERSSG
jgi:hypothetical protein